MFTRFSKNISNKEEDFNLNSSGTQTRDLISYNDYHAVSLISDWMLDISWKFSSSNRNVSITVLIMTEKNFNKFRINLSDYQSFTLSNGNLNKDEGRFKIPFSANWVIIFLNVDPIKQSTEVTYSCDKKLDLWLFFIIPLIINLIILFYGIILYYLSKRRSIKVSLILPVFFYVIFLSNITMLFYNILFNVGIW
ncbi:MAG: hypothetical protein P8Y70_07090 [Candidatus Lokiarchaeota archaeon]